MDISNTVFRRRFALNMYKDMEISLGQMSFSKDFVKDKRGDPYPLSEISDGASEAVANGVYRVKNGYALRYICSTFPYASYEADGDISTGRLGFVLKTERFTARIIFDKDGVCFSCGDREEKAQISAVGRVTYSVTCRPGAMDVYSKREGHTEFVHTFLCTELEAISEHRVFSKGGAYLYAENASVFAARSYIDNGISQADMRPIRYENGEVMTENGRIFFTASVRLQAGGYQAIFYWLPGTAEFEMTGVLLYDAGDGKWCGDVAASVLYHREKGCYMLWMCSFSHGHILGHSVFYGDIRYGVNVADITLMEQGSKSDITAFLGFKGDEDPDFFYDCRRGKWLMAICRIDPDTHAYRYVFFESDEPFEGYGYIGKGLDGAETGGSFVRIDGELCFACGNDFKAVSDYRIYRKSGMINPKFDLPDGGFRGWGSIIPLRIGSRTKYYWLTFDRHNGSGYNWSYGNVYVFEAE